MDPKERIMLWLNAFLVKPKKIFKEQRSKANLKEGAINVSVGGLVGAIIVGLFSSSSPVILAGGALVGIIFANLYWLITGGIFYVFAKFLGGSGELKGQLYLVSLYMPLIIIISSLLVPFQTLNILVSLYGLYLLTLALKEIHMFDMPKAILSWFIPLLITIGILAILILVFPPARSVIIGSMPSTGAIPTV